MITHASATLAYKIHQNANADFTLMVDENELPAMQTQQLRMIGNAYKPSHLLHEVLKLALAHEIDVMVSVDTEEQSIFMQNQLFFEEYGIQILSPQNWI